MPIIQIKALPQKEKVDTKKVMSRLCSEVAEQLNMSSCNVWATWEWIEPSHYVEGEAAAEMQPYSTHPPIVNFIAFEGRPPGVIEKAILRIAEILSTELKLEPGNVFINHTEAVSGRVFTGGKIIYRK